MKAFWWVMAGGLLILLMQYGMFRENGEPRQIPMSQQVAR